MKRTAASGRAPRRRRRGHGAIVVLAATLGLAGCGAPVSGTTAEHANGSAVEIEMEMGKASYYSNKLAGRPTASGEGYDPRALTAAHRTLPFGTMVSVAIRRAAGYRADHRSRAAPEGESD